MTDLASQFGPRLNPGHLDGLRSEMEAAKRAQSETRRGAALMGTVFAATNSDSGYLSVPVANDVFGLSATVDLPTGARYYRGLAWGLFSGYVDRNGLSSSAHVIFSTPQIDPEDDGVLAPATDSNATAYQFDTQVECPPDERAPFHLPFAFNIETDQSFASITATCRASSDIGPNVWAIATLNVMLTL